MSTAAALLAVLLAAAALLLAFAGLLKLLRPADTLTALGSAGLPASRSLVRALGLLEILIGATCVFIGGPMPTLALAAIHAGFAGFAFRLRQRDDTAACGCFGTGAPVSTLHIVDNLAIALLAAAAAIGLAPDIARLLDEAPWHPIVTVLGILGVTGSQHRLLTADRNHQDQAPRSGRTAPAELTGIDAATGDAVAIPLVGVPHDTAVVYLSSTCLTCRGIWSALHRGASPRLPRRTRLVIVTDGTDREDQDRIRTLAPPDRPTILSPDARLDLEIPGAPWALLISGRTGRITAEGTGTDWPSLWARLAAPARSER